MNLSALVLTVALIVAPLGAQVPPCAASLPTAEEQEMDEPSTEEELEAADEETADTESEENIEQADARISPAAAQTLDAVRRQMDELVWMLAQVVDVQTAAIHTPKILAAFEALRNVDFSILDAEDEELVAAEFAEDMFIRLDDEVSRLADADFFGNETLVALFGANADTETELRPAPAPVEPEIDAPVPEADTESATPANPAPLYKRP